MNISKTVVAILIAYGIICNPKEAVIFILLSGACWLTGEAFVATCKFFMNHPFKSGQETRLDHYAKRTTE